MDLVEDFGHLSWMFLGTSIIRWMRKAFPGGDFGMLHPQRSWIHTGDPTGLAWCLFPSYHHFQEFKHKECWIACPGRLQPLQKAGV